MTPIRPLRSFFLAACILFSTLLPTLGYAAPEAQGITPESRAEALLARMSPEEIVGQLFIINFEGNTLSENDPLYQLITSNHIGGVVLKRENDNFSDQDDVLKSTWELTQAIQNADYYGSKQPLPDPFTNELFSPVFIPLFIGISQDGGGYPGDQILSGLTPQASAMALGATWDPELAYRSGDVLGAELKSLGINLLFSPSLNLLVNPRPQNAGDWGTSSFGGNPYWVGEMGSAFIAGVHDGSQNNILVVANHFPGLSSPDRPPYEEVPTVLKTREQLLSLELIPFMLTMGNAEADSTQLDGVLLANAKYQGFQGDIRPATSPISLDAQAFTKLMSETAFNTWHSEGGLVISDELGSRAIRRFQDSSEENFNYRLVAMTAFLAGNDLLNLGDFSSNENPSDLTAILRTLDFFALKYRGDVIFQQRVDEIVKRILIKKFEMYNSFYLASVLAPEEGLNDIGLDQSLPIEIASKAITLFSPAADQLNTVLPAIPTPEDSIVIFTDSVPTRQCASCNIFDTIPPEAFQNEALRLYGSNAGGLVREQNIFSYTFDNLIEFLDSNDPSVLESILANADWVIFLSQDLNPSRPESYALHRLLSEKPGLIQEKMNLVFSFNAPYYLDATNISHISAYYGLYSSQEAYVNLAVRLLFKEIKASGASPVSVEGIGYDLPTATSADPAHSFSLQIIQADEEDVLNIEDIPGNIDASQVQVFAQNDTLLLETGLILDRNGNPIANETNVRVLQVSVGSEGISKEYTASTKNGKAELSIVLDIAGSFSITAFVGDPPASSDSLRIDVTAVENGTPSVSETPNENSSNPTSEIPVTPEPPTSGFDLAIHNGQIAEGHWLLLVIVNVFIALFAYQIGATTGRVRWGVRWALTSLIGGLLVVTMLSFGVEGSAKFIQQFQLWGLVIATNIGGFLGWGFGWLWYLFSLPEKN